MSTDDELKALRERLEEELAERKRRDEQLLETLRQRVAEMPVTRGRAAARIRAGLADPNRPQRRRPAADDPPEAA